ncbi:AAA family ATPase [Actinocorallia populi]|uniref:AAA family ATPase n=1 Tax=Actinocorallia populi TaxID=2079200 RepID=UPI000D08B58E|nr:AAA family ATPase [Actinocorallia populi]
MRVEVEDFRGFVEGALEVRADGVVLVVGGNGTGKGALVSALDVVAGRRAEGRTGHLGSGSGLVRGRFGLVVRTAWEISVDPVGAWAEWTFAEGSRDGMRAQAVAVGHGDGRGDVVGRLVETDGAWHVELADGEPGVLERVCGGEGTAPPGALEKAVAESRLHGVAEPLRRFREGYAHFRFGAGTAAGELPVRDVGGRLAEDGGNLGTVLLGLSTGEPRLWAELRRRAAEILPETGSPVTPVTGETFTVAFSQDGLLDEGWDGADVRIGLDEAGRGAERVLALLACLLTRPERVVVLEEPEEGLHPAAQRAVLELLREHGRERTFVVTTHAPVLIDRALTGQGSRVLSVRRRQGISTVAELDASTADAVRRTGLRLSDVAGCGRIIVLESAEDERILSAWIPEVLHDPDVGVVLEPDAPGLLEAWLDAGGLLASWTLLYAGAADGLTPALRAKAAASGVHLLGARSLDNLLLDFGALAGLLDAAFPGPPIVTPPDRLEAEARAFADEWRATGGAAHVPDEEWAERWTELIPGTDLLGELWRRFLGRPYSRREDGCELARTMRPPQALMRDIAAFLEA